MEFSFDSKVHVRPGVLVNCVEGEAVLLNLDSESYFGLDAVGTRMWNLLAASPTIQTAYDSLLAEFDVAPEQLQRDLRALIETLVANGLVELRRG
jgi:hypothetical protein